MFKVIDDIKLADELYNAGLLWWDAHGRTESLVFLSSSGRDYYRPSNYRKEGANSTCNYYILIEE